MSKLITQQEIMEQIAAERDALRAAQEHYNARRAELSAAAGRLLFNLRRDAGLSGPEMARIMGHPRAYMHHECPAYARLLDPEEILKFLPAYVAAIEFLRGEREKPLPSPTSRTRGRVKGRKLRTNTTPTAPHP